MPKSLPMRRNRPPPSGQASSAGAANRESTGAGPAPARRLFRRAHSAYHRGRNLEFAHSAPQARAPRETIPGLDGYGTSSLRRFVLSPSSHPRWEFIPTHRGAIGGPAPLGPLLPVRFWLSAKPPCLIRAQFTNRRWRRLPDCPLLSMAGRRNSDASAVDRES